jgi:uncharacterized protein YciI/ketosteroid isomerase-like protein
MMPQRSLTGVITVGLLLAQTGAAAAQQPPAQLAFDTSYVVLLEPNAEYRPASDADRRATQQAHLAYQLRLIADGHTVMGGPLVREPGDRFTGMSVLRASSRDAARQLADADPGVRDGLFLATVQTWTTVRSGSTDRAVGDTITATVLEFFRAMADNDVEASRRVLLDDGVRFSTMMQEDGPRLRREGNSDYLERLARGGQRLFEQIHHVDVQVRGTVATAWAPYDFYIDGQFSHCGTNAITLVRTGDGWRIASSAWTVEPDGCAPVRR